MISVTIEGTGEMSHIEISQIVHVEGHLIRSVLVVVMVAARAAVLRVDGLHHSGRLGEQSVDVRWSVSEDHGVAVLSHRSVHLDVLQNVIASLQSSVRLK
jgi:hypothetical protein